MQYPDEWTQEEYLKNKIKLEKMGIEVVLIDTILSPIERVKTQIYNPHEMQNYQKGSVFVFYCDTGKGTLHRLSEYKKKFPEYHCISLRGGRVYWKVNMSVSVDE